jgi:hypothetical protein
MPSSVSALSRSGMPRPSGAGATRQPRSSRGIRSSPLPGSQTSTKQGVLQVVVPLLRSSTSPSRSVIAWCAARAPQRRRCPSARERCRRSAGRRPRRLSPRRAAPPAHRHLKTGANGHQPPAFSVRRGRLPVRRQIPRRPSDDVDPLLSAVVVRESRAPTGPKVHGFSSPQPGSAT